jgi:predicted GNAT family N-acyltransferase
VQSRQFENPERPKLKSIISTPHGSARVSAQGYVGNVIIAHWERGQGHGHELMREVTKHADEHGMELTMHAREELHPFYQKHGFNVTDPDTQWGAELKRPAR